jgi:8-oxo-dGTP diphosphatase
MAPRSTPAHLDFPRPLVSVDVAIFTVIADALKVLLVQRPAPADAPGEPFPGAWALPGGFVDVAKDADLRACARRKLLEKTGVASPYLEELGSWGDATRDPRGWSTTHAWFALLPASGLRPAKGANTADVAWVDVDAVARRRLAFDHAGILRAAVERLRNKVEYTTLPAFLLDEPFTLPQLQRAYETVLGRPVDKSAFRTRMLSAGFLVEAGVVASDANRPPMGYRLKDRTAPAFFPRTFSPRG